MTPYEKELRTTKEDCLSLEEYIFKIKVSRGS